MFETPGDPLIITFNYHGKSHSYTVDGSVARWVSAERLGQYMLDWMQEAEAAPVAPEDQEGEA